MQRAYAQALLVDRTALRERQEANDALGAARTLRAGFQTGVEPLLAMARLRSGGAIDPVATYRASGWRATKAAERPQERTGRSGIV